MKIRKVIIENFKCFKGTFSLEFDKNVNIIVGLNEAGKSTILEAIHLALSGSFRGKPLKNELSQYLFNKEIEEQYISLLKENKGLEPPKINIEVFFYNDPSDSGTSNDLAKLEGSGNSDKEKASGIKYCIEFDDQYSAEYEELLRSTKINNTIPIEYYKVTWLSFARASLTSQSIPVKSLLIDSTNTCFYNRTDTYVSNIIRNNLDNKERVEIAQAHRQMKETFMQTESIRDINDKITDEIKIINKKIHISVNLSTQNAWENSLIIYLDKIPFHHIGKGEQSLVKTHLALSHKKSQMANIILLEEPENHLSHSKLNELLHKLTSSFSEKQIIVSTHNSFVANKIGINTLIVLHGGRSIKLNDLSDKTQDFFKKLPGYNTLRLVLCEKAILVEGPSDELIVQKAYMVKNNKLPIQDGIDVISVGTSFLRFLEIAEKIKKPVVVVTDNDGDTDSLRRRYEKYLSGEFPHIKICFNEDTQLTTLEPCILEKNDLDTLNKVFGTQKESKDKILKYMKNNKVECALKIFDTNEKITFPDYINNAIKNDV